MGRINVELSDELEKKLRFKTIEKFGGKKGDLSRAIEEAVKKWVTTEQSA
jgi:Ribbon-helix-helix domain